VPIEKRKDLGPRVGDDLASREEGIGTQLFPASKSCVPCARLCSGFLIRFLQRKWKSMNIIGAGEHGPAVERVETWNEGGSDDAVRPSAPEQNGLEPNVLGPHRAERE
jgi:hypothetical protein